MVLGVGDERRFESGELLEHVGDRGGGDGELEGDFGTRDLAFGASAELEDGFEIVVDGLAAGGGGGLGFGAGSGLGLGLDSGLGSGLGALAGLRRGFSHNRTLTQLSIKLVFRHG